MYVTNGDYHFPCILKDHGISLFAISHIDMIKYMLYDNNLLIHPSGYKVANISLVTTFQFHCHAIIAWPHLFQVSIMLQIRRMSTSYIHTKNKHPTLPMRYICKENEKYILSAKSVSICFMIVYWNKNIPGGSVQRWVLRGVVERWPVWHFGWLRATGRFCYPIELLTIQRQR